jgi:hypothetical protein
MLSRNRPEEGKLYLSPESLQTRVFSASKFLQVPRFPDQDDERGERVLGLSPGKLRDLDRDAVIVDFGGKNLKNLTNLRSVTQRWRGLPSPLGRVWVVRSNLARA